MGRLRSPNLENIFGHTDGERIPGEGEEGDGMGAEDARPAEIPDYLPRAMPRRRRVACPIMSQAGRTVGGALWRKETID